MYVCIGMCVCVSVCVVISHIMQMTVDTAAIITAGKMKIE